MSVQQTLSWGTALGLVLAGQLFGSALLARNALATDIATTPQQAYLADAAAAAEIRALEEQGYVASALRGIQLSYQCNVDFGCISRTLVMHTFETPGANTQTQSILAEVNIRFDTPLSIKYTGVRILELRSLKRPTGAIAFEPVSSSILDAYRSDPALAAEIEAARKVSRERSLQTFVIAGSCGVAGCGSDVLVVHAFSPLLQPEASVSILALVSVSPLRGLISGVERVELVPK